MVEIIAIAIGYVVVLAIYIIVQHARLVRLYKQLFIRDELIRYHEELNNINDELLRRKRK